MSYGNMMAGTIERWKWSDFIIVGTSQARKCEQDYFEQYNATLNSIEPCPKKSNQENDKLKSLKPSVYCEPCHDSLIQINSDEVQEIHDKSKSVHSVPYDRKCVSEYFNCETCDYSCRYQSDFNKHLMTRKHENKQTIY